MSAGPARDRRFSVRIGLVLAGVALLGLTFFLMVRSIGPRISEQQVQDVVYATIQREAPASFLVTGYVDVVAGTRVTNTNVLLPGLLDLRLGRSEATVRVPGRVSYGFDVGSLSRQSIRVGADSVVQVTLPAIAIYSAEPNLAQLEIETSRGWLRTEANRDKVTARALELLQTALRRQGNEHLRDTAQPRVNTARALEKMLTPALEAAGIPDPRFRFVIGEGVVLESQRP